MMRLTPSDLTNRKTIVHTEMFAAGHLLIGLLVGEIFVLIFSLDPSVALTAIGFGSIFPDLDVLLEQGKTFHYPKIATGASAVFLVILFALNVPIIAALGLFLLGVGIHSLTDILGGGIELRQWERKDNRGVYDHINERFIECRRLYYDGSLEDIGITVIIAMILLILNPYQLPLLVFAVLSVIGFRYLNIYVANKTQNFDTWGQLIKYQIFGEDPDRV